MSGPKINLCSTILKEYYGKIVGDVAVYLIRNGPTPLMKIQHDCRIKKDEVKKALTILVQQNMGSFAQSKRGFMEYSVDIDQILYRLRFPRYVYCAKTLYGDAAELVIESLLYSGQEQMSKIVNKVTERLREAYEAQSTGIQQNVTCSQVVEKFTNLANTHFVQRCATLNSDSKEEVTCDVSVSIPPEQLYQVPNVMVRGAQSNKRRLSDDTSEQTRKRQKSEGPIMLDTDSHILWRLNFQRFHQYMRDQVIINAAINKIDKKCGEVMRTVLRLIEINSDPEAPVTNAIISHDIHQALPKEVAITKTVMEQYLSLLSSDIQTEFLSKIGDSGGGLYQINFPKIMTAICRSHIESVVKERFGSKSLRIFRVLILKRQLEQKQIEEYAMIPAKEAKELLYKMFSEHFIKLTEVPKTLDHAPSRTFYLFSVDINQVARMLLERCYQTVDNVIKRRIHESKEHKRVLDKLQRVEAITSSLEQSGADAAQKEEIQEMITPPERAQLAKVKHMKNKLEQSEIQVDETMFVLQTFLHYSHKS